MIEWYLEKNGKSGGCANAIIIFIQKITNTVDWLVHAVVIWDGIYVFNERYYVTILKDR